MSILIGHAVGDENGGARGGSVGDQTGREVRIQDWYNGNWNLVLRPKSTVIAERMASACEILCRSNLVGYDQWDRNTLWDELEKVNWRPEALRTKCETDCSALMSACARIAGINIPRVALGGGKYNSPITQTMRSAFGSTGAFDVLTDSKYMTSDKYLKRGDVLVRESGHTAMALENGSATTGDSKPAAVTSKVKTASSVATHFDRQLAGTYQCTAFFLYVRHGAGALTKFMTTISKGTRVQCYGYYSLAGNVKWLYVQFEQNGTQYIGFASERYLQKVK